MITKEQAIEIAKKEVPDLMKRMSRISLEKPKAAIFGGVPDNCWYIVYAYLNPDGTEFNGLGSSYGIFIQKDTGKVVFNDLLMDEG
ncbi:MAG: hypothetical protein QY331_09080 [Melioribacteraceae bacterium]|nr:MAG: hypothetical protein QY331_09080 [Melioribacteraceae bacterium]